MLKNVPDTLERQKADTIVHSNEEVGFSSEIRSSLMFWTERKATIVATNPLHLQRWKGYMDVKPSQPLLIATVIHSS